MYTQDLYFSPNPFWLFKTKVWLEPAWAERYFIDSWTSRVDQPKITGKMKTQLGFGHFPHQGLGHHSVPLLSPLSQWMSAYCSWPSCLSLASAAAMYQWGSGFDCWCQCEESQRRNLWLAGFGLNVHPLTNQIDWTLDQSDSSSFSWLSNPGPISCVQWRSGEGKAKEHNCFSQAAGCCFVNSWWWNSGGLTESRNNLQTSLWTNRGYLHGSDLCFCTY